MPTVLMTVLKDAIVVTLSPSRMEIWNPIPCDLSVVYRNGVDPDDQVAGKDIGEVKVKINQYYNRKKWLLDNDSSFRWA